MVVLAGCQAESPAPEVRTTPTAPTGLSATPIGAPQAVTPNRAQPSPPPTVLATAAVGAAGPTPQGEHNRNIRTTYARPTRAPGTVPTTEPVEPASTPDPDTDIAHIRQLVEAYWGAWNDYDADRALAMLEEGYRALEDELIRKDMGRLKLFRVKLEVSEKSPPRLNAGGDYETHLTLGTPIDSRTVLMVFRRLEGRWWIVYSDEEE